MPVVDLSRFCENGTVIFRLAKTVEYNDTSGTIRVVAHSKVTDSDQRAVLYIVVVLLFYSCGIIIGIVMYLKRERAEMEEERAYEDYLAFRADPARMARHFCKQQYTTRLRQMEEEQRQRDLKVQASNLEKTRFSKKRLSHGAFHFLSSSKNTSPVGSPSTSAKPSPQIVIENFDEMVAEEEEKLKRRSSETAGHVHIQDMPTLLVQQDDLRAVGMASSMPSLNRSESRRSTLIVTEL